MSKREIGKGGEREKERERERERKRERAKVNYIVVWCMLPPPYLSF
jgi:hypothetical protein